MRVVCFQYNNNHFTQYIRSLNLDVENKNVGISNIKKEKGKENNLLQEKFIIQNNLSLFRDVINKMSYP